MRVLRLDVGATVTLHPAITVVSGLSGEQRIRFLDTLRAVGSGGAVDITGLVEVAGIHLDFDRATLELLDLIGQDPIDIVVRPSDLPGGKAHGEQAVAEAQADVERLTPLLAATRAEADEAAAAARQTSGLFGTDAVSGASDPLTADELEEAMGEARVRLERLVNARQQAQRRRDRAERGLEDQRILVTNAEKAAEEAAADLALAIEVRDRLQARIDELNNRLDAEAPGRLAAARSVLSDLERRRDEAARAATEPRRRSPEYRRFESALAAIELTDTSEVEAALEPLARKAAAREPVPEAEALAAEWRRVTEELVKAGLSGAESSPGLEELEAARNRLEEARGRVEDAERQVRGPVAPHRQVEELIHAHEAVIAALDKADRRLMGSRSRKRLEEARAEEQRLLDELKFSSWTDFLMSAGGSKVDGDAVDYLAAARHDLIQAQEAWEALAPRVEGELARAILLSRRQAVRVEAARLLDRPTEDDPTPALRALRRPVAPAPEELGALRSALSEVGITIDDDESLVPAAEKWLEGQRQAAAERDALAEELVFLDEVDAEQHAAALAQVPPVSDDELELAALEVSEAEERLARHQELDAQRSRLASELEAAMDRIEVAEDERDARIGAAHVVSTRDTAAAAVELHAAEAALAEAADACAAAEAELAELKTRLTGTRDRSRRQAESDASAQRAAAAAAGAARGVATLEAELAAAQQALAKAQSPEPIELDWRGRDDRAALVSELEWYLLARLAAQRSVGLAGSLPLVLDDALAELKPVELPPVLERLERIAASVQVIMVTDDPTTLEWAARAGQARAAVVSVGSRAG